NQRILQYALFLFGLAGFVGAAETQPSSSTANRGSFLLTPAKVFSSEDGKTHEGWSVLVISNRIAAVGPANEVKAPPDAVKIQLAGMTLLPGLMDIHSHI